MLVSYATPELNARAFNCPHCGVYAKQDWGVLYRNRLDINNGRLIINQDNKLNGFRATSCENCYGPTIWYNDKIIFPFAGGSIQPNNDMPDDIKVLFVEARSILFLSAKSACALLRLALKKLCVFLGGQGTEVEQDISALVEKGLPPRLAQALYSLKTYGSHAIRPGQIDENDDINTAHKLLVFLNIICDNQITQPKLIEHYAGEII